MCLGGVRVGPGLVKAVKRRGEVSIGTKGEAPVTAGGGGRGLVRRVPEGRGKLALTHQQRV